MCRAAALAVRNVVLAAVSTGAMKSSTAISASGTSCVYGWAIRLKEMSSPPASVDHGGLVLEQHGYLLSLRLRNSDPPASRNSSVALTYNRMVVGELPDDEVDRMFHALADATRRDILRRCVGGEPSVSRLAHDYPMSFAAVQKHVAVLERAGMVVKERRGREQLVRTDPGALGQARL